MPGEDPEEPDDPDVPGEGMKSGSAHKNIRTRRSFAAAKLRFKQKWSDVLVVDDLPSHTAHTLCESHNSAGPSFVNVDHGFFCDMQTRTVHPVCDKETKQTEVCFDTEQNELGRLPNFFIFTTPLHGDIGHLEPILSHYPSNR